MAATGAGIGENGRKNERRREVSLSASRVNWRSELSAPDRKAPHTDLPRTGLRKEIREQPYFEMVGEGLVLGKTTDGVVMLPLPQEWK